MYSVFEQHLDGSWWYHRASHKTKEEAEDWFKKAFWWDLERPYQIFEHDCEFPDMTLYTRDFKSFYSIGGKKEIWNE